MWLEPGGWNLDGIFRLEPGGWNLVVGSWLEHVRWNLVVGSWNLVVGTWWLEPLVWNLVVGTRWLGPSGWNLDVGTRWLEPGGTFRSSCSRCFCSISWSHRLQFSSHESCSILLFAQGVIQLSPAINFPRAHFALPWLTLFSFITWLHVSSRSRATLQLRPPIFLTLPVLIHELSDFVSLSRAM